MHDSRGVVVVGRCVITPSYVLVLNPDSEGVRAFAQVLQRACAPEASSPHTPTATDSISSRKLRMPRSPDSIDAEAEDDRASTSGSEQEVEGLMEGVTREADDLCRKISASNASGAEALPFELRALEAVLDTVRPCTCH